MDRLTLEKLQAFVYLVAITLGLTCGYLEPQFGRALAGALWPALAFLLYATFSQIPLVHLPGAFLSLRFQLAAVTGNFLAIPVLVWLLLSMVPDEPALKLGIALVLLVPCTDWFIPFTQLGGGDTEYAITFSPISLVLQIITLPVYLFIFFGKEFTASIAGDTLWQAFVGLILLPLFAAFVTQKWAVANKGGARAINCLAWLPVPVLALVIFIICASQVQAVLASRANFGSITVVFVLFLVFTAILAKLIAVSFRLPARQGRVLAFSMGTRNSFVVLPLALALPAQFAAAVVVVVYQPLVELLGMLFYLWFVPKKMFKDTAD